MAILNSLFFIGALLIPFIPNLTRTRLEFIDIILLYFLYIDFTVIFVLQSVYYLYLVNVIVLLYSLKFFLLDNRPPARYFMSVVVVTFVFLAVFFLFPILHSENINLSTRFFSVTFASVILLPIALFHYSMKGDLHKVLRNHYHFLLLWGVFVLIATLFKLGGEVSTHYGGSVLYFGFMARRGSITYISFALLLVPLLYRFLKRRERIVVLLCTGLVVIALLSSLKRFVFIVIALGVGNYLLKRKLKARVKIGIVAALGLTFIFIPTSTGMQQALMERYAERGGEGKFSVQAMENDIRIDEPLFVLDYMRRRSSFDFLFGIKTDLIIEINAPRVFKKREIHNEYAMLFLKFGIIGLVLYLMIFFLLYRRTAKIKRLLERQRINVSEYWIVFQNLLLIFVLEGMVGGHSHITFRGMVLVYCGAIAGHFYKLAKGNQGQHA